MFVMCNAVDQTDLNQPAFTRIHKALGHAGPAITVTSLTNALAFAFGALSSLEALKSFCLFASLCIVFLYLTVMTVFLSVVVWDTKRVEKKWTECCNVCSLCCGETNPICCCGVCTTHKQKAYCNVEFSEKTKASMKAQKESASPAVQTVLEASCTERCLGKYFAPMVLGKIGRIVFLVIYVIMIALGIYGCTELTVAFDVEYFISENSAVFTYYEASEKYFNQGGGEIKTYIDNSSIDFSSEESQRKILNFMDKTENFDWYIKNTQRSWYKSFLEDYQGGKMVPSTDGGVIVCSYDSNGDSPLIIPEIIEVSHFYPCFNAWKTTDKGKN